MNAPDPVPMRLTEFSHGGGCGCKIAPGVLQQIIAKAGPSLVPKELMVGIETSDDAAVYRINDRQAIVATTDFFMPIVDDPFDFGAIAATNAISDVYAMGATPLFALALVGMPVAKLPVEPIYGLVAIGIVDPSNLKRNAGAKPGDLLVLGKPLGVGIYSAALKKGKLAADGYAAMIASTTKLNTPGLALGTMPGVHALTDVTGFGLAGHLLEICRGSDAGAVVDFARVPLHPGVADLVRAGHATGASGRNWAGYGADVRIDAPDPDLVRTLVTDPQTSGGLLVACAPADVDGVLAAFARDGFDRAAVIGEIVAGAPHVVVR
jgi:selenide,water dikinase